MLVVPPTGFMMTETARKHGLFAPPLGLAYLASVLEKNDIPVEILDAYTEGYSWKDLKNKFLSSKPDVIGITFATETRFEGFKTIRIAKTVLPNSITVAGGPHASLTPYDTLYHIAELDFIVRGEGEYILFNLVKTLEDEGDLRSVLGLSYRDNGKIIHNPDRPFIEDLDMIPFPARHLLPMDKYNFKLNIPGRGKIPAANVATSRGCSFKCCFCAASKMSGRRWRARSPQNVLDEVEHIIKVYNKKAMWFFDDTFTMSKKRTEQICDQIIQRGLDISWFCDIRVDTVDKPLLKKMKDAGCYRVCYGVESGSQRILDEVIGKKIKLDQVRKVSAWCKELGILEEPMFIVSLPSETITDFKKTKELMDELDGEAILSILQIYPGTKIERIARQKGILPKGFSWSVKNNSIVSLPTVVGDVPIFVDKLSWEEISEILLEWAEVSNYPKFKHLPTTIKNIKSFDDLKRLFIMNKVYLRRKIKSVCSSHLF